MLNLLADVTEGFLKRNRVGTLYWAPLGSREPINNVRYNHFTDEWPATWQFLSIVTFESIDSTTCKFTLFKAKEMDLHAPMMFGFESDERTLRICIFNALTSQEDERHLALDISIPFPLRAPWTAYSTD